MKFNTFFFTVAAMAFSAAPSTADAHEDTNDALGDSVVSVNTNLRGGGGERQEGKLYLALDSPPQVWSIGAFWDAQGQMTLKSC